MEKIHQETQANLRMIKKILTANMVVASLTIALQIMNIGMLLQWW